MNGEQLEKLVKDKIAEALKNSEHPKKFFVTENGRGVVDGGDLYNALLKDVLDVVGNAMANIFIEIASAGENSNAPKSKK